jgi:hypothetical protein
MSSQFDSQSADDSEQTIVSTTIGSEIQKLKRNFHNSVSAEDRPPTRSARRRASQKRKEARLQAELTAAITAGSSLSAKHSNELEQLRHKHEEELEQRNTESERQKRQHIAEVDKLRSERDLAETAYQSSSRLASELLETTTQLQHRISGLQRFERDLGRDRLQTFFNSQSKNRK